MTQDETGKNDKHNWYQKLLCSAHFAHLAPLFSDRHSGFAGASQHSFV